MKRLKEIATVKKLAFLGAISLVAIAAASMLTQPIVTEANNDEISNVRVHFAEDKPIKDVLREASEQKLQVIALQDSFGANEIEFTDFYFLSSKKINEKGILKDYKKSRASFIQDTVENMKDIKSQGKNSATEKLAGNTLDSLQKLQREIKRENIKVEGAIVRGHVKDVEAVKENLGIIRVEKIGQANQNSGINNIKSSQMTTLALDSSTWAPKMGYSFIHPSSHGGRYTSQYMWWNNVSGFNSTSTYEHDFFLNNYDGKTYLDAGQDYWGFPNITYASSNLPRAYFDTRAMDADGEKAYTIGSAKASDIQANTGYWYLNYIRTANGNTNTDSGKLQAQLGYRSPSWCYSTWCSFSESIINLIPAWKVGVPGSWYWQR